jgi:hypothetical protein
MKPMAYNRHKYSGDFYKFVLETVGDSSETKYYFVGPISITAGLDISGRLGIRSDQPIPINSVIANIKDSKGELILDDSAWQITGLEPVLNAFNNIDSYRMKAVKYQGIL